MKRFRLIPTSCRRCGKPLYTGNRSLYGFDKEKRELDRICEKCITPEEKERMLKLVPFIR